ncbi:hypothetical protein ADIMK_0138 [Marinobacterium lacunae]|uniref:Uncharacterized protein n=1 Tax=Marinobacterium lacunae TaxID=1232683 RepID=A0A081G4B1_9GAMM|nr:hypothetical protein [Marinobacterium lacunae]KEA65616.1 hypothetical protein ADIMK_0138 [Marinobacterium lacunae]MBR9885670.1 hypothetical protein [Oceanospirillales bacterium]
MAKYYLDLEPKSDVGNQIHDSQCSQMPAKSALRYIGSYSNPEAARYDVKMYHDQVSYCPDCIKQ